MVQDVNHHCHSILHNIVLIHNIKPADTSYQRRVIDKVSQDILQCKCTRQLLPHLVRRKILTDGVCAQIISQSESKDVVSINRILKGVAAEPGRQNVVGDLYLALLDCCEESPNMWCHIMAISKLRQAGKDHYNDFYVQCSVCHFSYSYVVLLELKQVDVNHYGSIYMYHAPHV